jgi:hypothetical protein
VEIFGYLIVEKQENIYNKYINEVDLPFDRAPYLNKLRLAFPSINPNAYRGVYREPLEGGTVEQVDLFSDPARVLPGRGWDASTRQARLKMAEVLAYKFEESSKWQDYPENEKTFLRIEDALRIYNLLGNPNDFEIILVRRHDFERTPNTFGFDIGYWGGDDYSIVCDTFVRPQWHSAPEGEFHNLTSFASRLNSNVLFDSSEQAREFLTYYRTTSWGEPDDNCFPELGESDYTIIQVDGVLP